jgi:hypothetical protein
MLIYFRRFLMKKRQIYHVTPSPGGGWNIKKEGGQRSSGHYDTKDQAVDRGRDLAKSSGLGQIKIHKQDGKFQTEHTYGKDPYPPKG